MISETTSWHIEEFIRSSWELAMNAKYHLNEIYKDMTNAQIQQIDKLHFERIRGQRIHLSTVVKVVTENKKLCETAIKTFNLPYEYKDYPEGIPGSMALVPEDSDLSALRATECTIEKPFTEEIILKNHRIFANDIVLAHNRLKYHQEALIEALGGEDNHMLSMIIYVMETASAGLAFSRRCLGENLCSIILWMDDEELSAEEQESLRNTYVDDFLSSAKANTGRLACVDLEKLENANI